MATILTFTKMRWKIDTMGNADQLIIGAMPQGENKFKITEDEENQEYAVLGTDAGIEVVNTSDISLSKFEIWREAAEEYPETYICVVYTAEELAEMLLGKSGFEIGEVDD